MAPSYINILNVYAIANVHDISWGTKGEVEAEVPVNKKDINALYQDAQRVLNMKPPKVESKPDIGTQQEDYYRTFRTNVLPAWVLTNAILGAAIPTTNAKASAEGLHHFR